MRLRRGGKGTTAPRRQIHDCPMAITVQLPLGDETHDCPTASYIRVSRGDKRATVLRRCSFDCAAAINVRLSGGEKRTSTSRPQAYDCPATINTRLRLGNTHTTAPRGYVYTCPGAKTYECPGAAIAEAIARASHSDKRTSMPRRSSFDCPAAIQVPPSHFDKSAAVRGR